MGELLFSDDEFLMISGLQHVAFCERQAALIHVERLWEENFFTAQGHLLHEKVDMGGREIRSGIIQTFDVPLVSQRLGIRGIADVVEWENNIPFPVEYKRGNTKTNDIDRVQLCAQALCLEEMHGVTVPRGAIFYGKTRRREFVEFTVSLRQKTEATVARFHEIMESGITPPPIYTKACESCSLLHWCLPQKMQDPDEAVRYVSSILEESE